MAQSGKRRRASIGFLFWIAFILLVVVIFLANRGNIEQVVENTGILEVLRDRVDSEPERDDRAVDPTTSPADNGTDPPSQENDSEPDQPLVLFDIPAREEPAVQETVPAPVPVEEPSATPEPEPPAVTEPEIIQRSPSPDPERPNRRMANLYFIRVTETGRTYPDMVTRPVYYESSPLTETIKALIAGPTSGELENGLLNLIPEGTELISASVQNGVAYLSFNQAFRFNSLGAEGTVAQLLQIIYSSTEFSTVERVQFMIDGERLDYLSGDGIYVGEPLGRDSFSS